MNSKRFLFEQPSALFGIALAVSAIPLFLVQLPPLVDYHNHLARMHILAKSDNIPQLREFYQLHWAVLPNLAMDIIVPFLSRFMSVYQAGKVFIFLIFFLLAGGTLALHRALFGNLSCWPLLGFYFLYNRSVLWGNMNYIFGVGLCLWIFAGWVYCAQRSWKFRLPLFWALSLILFFSHLFAFGVYGLCIAGYTLHRHRQKTLSHPWAEWAMALSQFLIPAILILFFSPTATSRTLHAFEYGSIARKLVALFQPINTYNRYLDGTAFFILIFILLWGLWREKIELSPYLRYPLLLLALFFLVMPELLLGVLAVDTRMPTPAAFLLAAGTRFYWQNHSGKIILATILVVIFLCRTLVIAVHWKAADAVYTQYFQAINQMEAGSRLFGAVAYPRDWRPFPVPVAFVPCMAIIEKNALVPSLYANRSQQPVLFAPDYQWRIYPRREFHAVYNTKHSPKWGSISRYYDYILLSQERFFSRVPAEELEIIYKGKDFSLYRTNR